MKQSSNSCHPFYCFVLVLPLTSITLADVVGIFYDSTVPQSDFAASEIKCCAVQIVING